MSACVTELATHIPKYSLSQRPLLSVDIQVLMLGFAQHDLILESKDCNHTKCYTTILRRLFPATFARILPTAESSSFVQV